MSRSEEAEKTSQRHSWPKVRRPASAHRLLSPSVRPSRPPARLTVRSFVHLSIPPSAHRPPVCLFVRYLCLLLFAQRCKSVLRPIGPPSVRLSARFVCPLPLSSPVVCPPVVCVPYLCLLLLSVHPLCLSLIFVFACCLSARCVCPLSFSSPVVRPPALFVPYLCLFLLSVRPLCVSLTFVFSCCPSARFVCPLPLSSPVVCPLVVCVPYLCILLFAQRCRSVLRRASCGRRRSSWKRGPRGKPRAWTR